MTRLNGLVACLTAAFCVSALGDHGGAVFGQHIQSGSIQPTSPATLVNGKIQDSIYSDPGTRSLFEGQISCDFDKTRTHLLWNSNTVSFASQVGNEMKWFVPILWNYTKLRICKKISLCLSVRIRCCWEKGLTLKFRWRTIDRTIRKVILVSVY